MTKTEIVLRVETQAGELWKEREVSNPNFFQTLQSLNRFIYKINSYYDKSSKLVSWCAFGSSNLKMLPPKSGISITNFRVNC